MKKQAIAILALLFTLTPFASTVGANNNYEEVTENGFTYRVYDDYANMFSADGYTGGALVPPDKVEGKPLTVISANFEDLPIQSIDFPINLESFTGSFDGNKNLTSVSFNQGLRFIGVGAFRGTSLSGKITLPDSLERIGDSAFAGGTLNGKSTWDYEDRHKVERGKITGVQFGKKIDTISDSVFAGNSIKSTNDIIFHKETEIDNMGSAVFSSNLIETLKIPKNLNVVATKTFVGNPIRQIVEPDDDVEISSGIIGMPAGHMKEPIIGDNVPVLEELVVGGWYKEKFHDKYTNLFASNESTLNKTPIEERPTIKNLTFTGEVKEANLGNYNYAISENIILEEGVESISSGPVREGVRSITASKSVVFVGITSPQLEEITVYNKETNIGMSPLTNAVVRGYAGSTAEEYANKGNNVTFIPLDDEENGDGGEGSTNTLNTDINVNLLPGTLLLNLTKSNFVDSFEVALKKDAGVNPITPGELTVDIIDNRGVSGEYTINMEVEDFSNQDNTSLPSMTGEYKLDGGDPESITFGGVMELSKHNPKDNPVNNFGLSIENLAFDTNKVIESGDYKSTITIDVVSDAS